MWPPTVSTAVARSSTWKSDRQRRCRLCVSPLMPWAGSMLPAPPFGVPPRHRPILPRSVPSPMAAAIRSMPSQPVFASCCPFSVCVLRQGHKLTAHLPIRSPIERFEVPLRFCVRAPCAAGGRRPSAALRSDGRSALFRDAANSAMLQGRRRRYGVQRSGQVMAMRTGRGLPMLCDVPQAAEAESAGSVVGRGRSGSGKALRRLAAIGRRAFHSIKNDLYR